MTDSHGPFTDADGRAAAEAWERDPKYAANDCGFFHAGFRAGLAHARSKQAAAVDELAEAVNRKFQDENRALRERIAALERVAVAARAVTWHWSDTGSEHLKGDLLIRALSDIDRAQADAAEGDSDGK